MSETKLTRSDLLCCPFCGSASELVEHSNVGINTIYTDADYPFAVECAACPAVVPFYKTAHDAITDWNRRA